MTSASGINFWTPYPFQMPEIYILRHISVLTLHFLTTKGSLSCSLAIKHFSSKCTHHTKKQVKFFKEFHLRQKRIFKTVKQSYIHILKVRKHLLNPLNAEKSKPWFFSENVRAEPSRRLSAKELALSNCGAGEDS